MQILRTAFKLILPSNSLNSGSFTRILQRSMSSASKKRRRLHGKEERLVWVDLEMSGLDVDKEHILEMACLVTDADLNIVAETDDIVIHQPDSVLDNMDEWCKQHHGESGLTEAVKKSEISLTEAEGRMLKFVQEYTIKGKAPLAGNSIHADRMFLAKYMPHFLNHLHYRIVDVTTIKELSRRWYPREFSQAPKKSLSHRALDDIKESIEELRYYRANIFKQEDGDQNSGDTGS